MHVFMLVAPLVLLVVLRLGLLVARLSVRVCQADAHGEVTFSAICGRRAHLHRLAKAWGSHFGSYL
jgi:hypothetical protein